jgi:hypothetical protein
MGTNPAGRSVRLNGAADTAPIRSTDFRSSTTWAAELSGRFWADNDH